MCGMTRVGGSLRVLSLQSALIGVVTALHGWEDHVTRDFWLAGVVILAKAAAVPLFLSYTSDQIGIERDPGAMLGPTIALPAGCGALAAGIFLTPDVAGRAAADRRPYRGPDLGSMAVHEHGGRRGVVHAGQPSARGSGGCSTGTGPRLELITTCATPSHPRSSTHRADAMMTP
jgi:hypothetical protein